MSASPHCRAIQTTTLHSLAFLKDLISTFLFGTEADRAVALSAILTALIRRSLRTAPLHGFNAPTAGTFAALDRMMREHLDYLTDMPLGSFEDGA